MYSLLELVIQETLLFAVNKFSGHKASPDDLVSPFSPICGVVLFPVSLLVLLMPHSEIHDAVSGKKDSRDHYAGGNLVVRWVEDILRIVRCVHGSMEKS